MIRVVRKTAIPLFCLLIIFSTPSFAEELVNEAVYEDASQWGLVYPVKNLIERIYDEDGDGALIDIEVLYFLRDVMRAARRKGKFQVVSSILKQYDEDQDGWISKDEAKSIEAFLY